MKVFQRYSLEFDRDNLTYIKFTDVGSFDGYEKFTIVAWAKRYERENIHTIFARKSEIGDTGITIYLGGDNVSWSRNDVLFFYKNNMSANHVRFDGVIDTLDWNMYTFIVDQELFGFKEYFNDVLVADITIVLDKYFNITRRLNGVVYIGALGEDSNIFTGKIGEVRIYDRPLTNKEVQYLYNGGHIEDGLVFWLYPDEDSVTLDTDGQTVLSVTEKINGYEGTAYNGVKLVDGKDIDIAKSSGKKFLIVRKV